MSYGARSAARRNWEYLYGTLRRGAVKKRRGGKFVFRDPGRENGGGVHDRQFFGIRGFGRPRGAGVVAIHAAGAALADGGAGTVAIPLMAVACLCQGDKDKED